MSPEYDYKCPICDTIKTVRHSMLESPEIYCDDHGEQIMKKLISRNTVVTFKGSDWTRKEQANDAAGIPREVADTAERLGKL